MTGRCIPEEIYYRAGKLLGGEPESLRLFCDLAEEELKGRLKEGICPEDCVGRFTTAAALLAAAMCLETENGEKDLESYSAGDVSVKFSSGAKRRESASERMKNTAEEIMSRYTDDGGFAFMRVRGT